MINLQCSADNTGTTHLSLAGRDTNAIAIILKREKGGGIGFTY